MCGAACPAGQQLKNFVCAPIDDNTPVGGCGTSGPCNPQHALATCTSTGCGYVRCEPGWGDCDGDAANGCETNLLGADNCGACGVACSGADFQCTPSGCAATCAAPATTCAVGGACTDLTDTANCGACGKVCALPYAIAASVDQACAYTCAAGATMCGSSCVDLATDDGNCGACGKACSSLAACVNGACTCPEGFTDCGGTCSFTQYDAQNCGGCGVSCGTYACVAGVCTTGEGPLGWLNLKATPIDIAVDAENVYWSDEDNDVLAAPRSGGAVVTLATGQSDPSALALDDTYVYWANRSGNTIFRAPKDGSATPSLVATAQALTSAETLAVVGGYVYFAETSGSLYRVPAQGGQPTVWYTPNSSYGLTGAFTDPAGSSVWAPLDSSMYAFAGGTLTTLFDISTAAAQTTIGTGDGAVDGINSIGSRYAYSAYSVDQYEAFSLEWMDKTSLSTVGKILIPYSGTAGTSPPTPGGVASNGCAAFFTNGAEVLMSRPDVGGELIPLLASTGPAWGKIVYDSGYVYWLASSAIAQLAVPE